MFIVRILMALGVIFTCGVLLMIGYTWAGLFLLFVR